LGTDELNNLLRAGIQAAKDKKRNEARELLQKVLELDDSNETAWMWLATVMETPKEQRICLENVLEINPNNERARQMLERLRPTPITGNTVASPRPPQAPPVTVTNSAPPRQSVNRPVTNKPLPDARAAQQRRVQAAQGRRRTNPLVFVVGGVIAVALIILGGYLFSTTQTTGSATSTSVANNATLAASRFPATSTPESTLPTRDPNMIPSIPPTWTDQPTVTLRPTFTLPPTLPPLTAYHLVFIGEGRSQPHPNLYALSGKDETQIVPQDVTEPSFSPDGKYVAFVVGADTSSPQIGTANADGSNFQSVTKISGAKHLHAPNWSPDGKRIVYSSDETGVDQVYTMAADGTGITQLTNAKYPSLYPSYAPDGKSIVYSSDPSGGAAKAGSALEIFLFDLATTKSTQLTESQGVNTSPRYSPDGKLIAFISTRDGQHNVYVMEPDGTNENLVTYNDNSAENIDLSWSPDSKYIIFSSDRNGGVFNIFAATPDGGVVQQLTNAKDKTYGGLFRP
jgi:TolB protein